MWIIHILTFLTYLSKSALLNLQISLFLLSHLNIFHLPEPVVYIAFLNYRLVWTKNIFACCDILLREISASGFVHIYSIINKNILQFIILKQHFLCIDKYSLVIDMYTRHTIWTLKADNDKYYLFMREYLKVSSYFFLSCTVLTFESPPMPSVFICVIQNCIHYLIYILYLWH